MKTSSCDSDTVSCSDIRTYTGHLTLIRFVIDTQIWWLWSHLLVEAPYVRHKLIGMTFFYPLHPIRLRLGSSCLHRNCPHDYHCDMNPRNYRIQQTQGACVSNCCNHLNPNETHGIHLKPAISCQMENHNHQIVNILQMIFSNAQRVLCWIHVNHVLFDRVQKHCFER